MNPAWVPQVWLSDANSLQTLYQVLLVWFFPGVLGIFEHNSKCCGYLSVFWWCSSCRLWKKQGFTLKLETERNSRRPGEAMSAGRGDPNTPANRPLFLSAGVPNLGCHNVAAPAAAGNSGSIASQVLFSPCSTSVLNTIQEVPAPQSALLSPINRATEQGDVPCIQPSWNMPGGCTQVPINIIVFHRELTRRGSRPQLSPSATALPDVSEGKHVLSSCCSF